MLVFRINVSICCRGIEELYEKAHEKVSGSWWLKIELVVGLLPLLLLFSLRELVRFGGGCRSSSWWPPAPMDLSIGISFSLMSREKFI